jgi:hypothetical protein
MSFRGRPAVVLAASLFIVGTSTRLEGAASAPSATPVLILDRSEAIGPMVLSPGGPIQIVTIAITDSVNRWPPFDNAFYDTIPSRARIEFRWHAEPEVDVAGFRYRISSGGAFVEVDSSVHGVDFNTGIAGDVLPLGPREFTLRVVDHDGAEREIRRYFFLDHAPETWIAGPDLGVLDARFGWDGPPRSLAIADWNALPDLSGTLLSCDSLTVRPGERPERRTFFEIYGDRLYVRSERDTVHMNSWVVFHGGGFDADSPYEPIVGPGDPALADTLECATDGTPWTVRPDGIVGSPIGFRSRYQVTLEPPPILATAPQSVLSPNFDPASVFYSPMIGSYARVQLSGKAYFLLRAQDADGLRDQSVEDARAIVEAVDGGTGTPEQIALRHKILTFFIDQAPFLRFDNPAFVPRPDHVFASRSLDLHLLADDSDPYDPSAGPSAPGGPSALKMLRWNIALLGRDADGRDMTIHPLPAPAFTPDLSIEVPAVLADPHVTIQVELCDCANCEALPGSGRCATYAIPVTVDGVTGTLASLVSTQAMPERVRLEWQLQGPGAAVVERRASDSGWEARGEIDADGSGRVGFEDRAVTAGARYGYRLVLTREGTTLYAGEVWVDVPQRVELALEGMRPNPSAGGDGLVRFSLTGSGPARLELLDVSGRRIARRELDSFGPGRHEIRFEPLVRLAAGVYLLRLVEGTETRTARATVMR